MKTSPKPNISRITVSRLYNLGNYENCSYALTVDIPSGASAAKAVRAVERILIGLKPIRKLYGPDEERAAMAEIARIRLMDAEHFERSYGKLDGGKRAHIKRLLEENQRRVKASVEAIRRSALARNFFDDLGGAEKWKDAKLDWEYDDDFR